MVLDQYEESYKKLVRQRGKLTFYDLQLILGNGDENRSRPLLSQRPGDDGRMRIDYRLDTRYDHWLLDEFQDTSYLQWSVIENLIDEAVQDTSGQRSLFQVGDMKQAIYAWRGGDVKLFDDIRERYNQRGDRILLRPLNDSWRSCPAVIEMVNATFGKEEVLRYLFPDKAIDRWRWGDHRSRHPDWTGYACFLQPKYEDARSSAEQTASRYDLMIEILKEVKPAERGLSCAVLVQTNKVGYEIVDWIRAHSDVPVMSESLVFIAEDNPVTSALLDLVQYAAHPGDSFAWQHLMMTPFKGVIADGEWSADELVLEVLSEAAEKGFESLMRTWSGRLLAQVPDLDEFGRARITELTAAARQFDVSGNRDVTEFLQFARNYSVREPACEGVVQVMTIHKSKGLGFDVVILPDLGGNSLTTIRRGLAVHRVEDRSVEWVMSLPQKDIAKADPRLYEYHEEKEAEACYEGLCALYVAMTRSKRAMYVIADKVVNRGKPTANYPRLLEKTLGREGDEIEFGEARATAIFQSGDRDWAQTISIAESAAGEGNASDPLSGGWLLKEKSALAMTPSTSEAEVSRAAQIFSRERSKAKRYGTDVHRLLEQIEWFEDGTVQRMKEYARQEDLEDYALEEVLGALESEEVRKALGFPGKGVQLWREKRFEVMLDGTWISGAVDRVVLMPDGSAEILDFKTDADAEGDASFEQKHARQSEIYRRVLAQLLGVDENRIRCRLLLTGSGTLRELSLP